jgi:hypothetical protein
MGFAMQWYLLIEPAARSTKDENITVFYNWLRKIISTTSNASTTSMILRNLLLSIILFSFIFPLTDVFAQHMMMPPAASVGNRKIMLSLQTEPANIKSSQKVLTKLAFVDENTKQTVQHIITVRMDVSYSKDGKHILSEFFHAHNGKINIDFRPNGGLRYAVSGNMDDLTNAWVADPGSPIIVNGPVFSQRGEYKIILEVTTIDNDKTVLPQPLKYELNVPVS